MRKKAICILFLLLLSTLYVVVASKQVQACDCKPPTIQIISPENKTYATNFIPLIFTLSKVACWIGYSLDGQVNATILGNTTLTNLSDGSHNVVVYANDTYGNMGVSNEVYFSVDTIPPTIVISSPENKTYSANDIPLTFTVDEVTSWMGYSLDEQVNTTISGNLTLSDLPDGSHHVVIYADDTVGNMGMSNTVCFTVDTTPPNITYVSQTPLPDNVLPEDEVKVNATVIDILSGVKQVILNYTNGNGTWVAVSMTYLAENVWNATIPPFPYCTNVTYVIMASDYADNTITTEEKGYELSYHVIPEFPSLLILPLFMIVTIIAALAYRRRRTLKV